MNKTSDLLNALAVLAEKGPTGITRPVGQCVRRYREEIAELRSANTPWNKAEEAGDACYYALLAERNGLPKFISRPMMRVAARKAGISFERALRAALAKYHIRFVVNERRKDHEAEWAAIRAALGL